MKKILIFLISTGLIFISGCSEDTADEKMDKYSKSLYQKYVSESKFCNAILVAEKRFHYIDDNKTSDLIIIIRKKEWDGLSQKIAIDCQKEKWPEKEKNYKNSIDKAKSHINLSEKINAQIRVSSPKKDSLDRNCIRELKITNNSEYFIHAFEGSIFVQKNAPKDLLIKWEMQRASRPMPMQSEEFTKAVPPINPKETRELNLCQFFTRGISNSLEGEKIIDTNKIDLLIDDISQFKNLPLTSTDEMQGRYMKLQLKNISIGNENNTIKIDVSKKHINNLKKLITESEISLQKENPFN